VRDVGQDILDNVKGRFVGKEIDIQDVDLYQVLGRRVLKPVKGREQVLAEAVRDSLAQLPRSNWTCCMTCMGRNGSTRRCALSTPSTRPSWTRWCRSPTCSAGADGHQRHVRHALRPGRRAVGHAAALPSGLWLPHRPGVRRRAEGPAGAPGRQDDHARQGYALLEDAHLGNAERVAKGQAAAQSIILGQLTDKGVSLRGRMTPPIIAALNAAVLNAKVVILARKQLDETISLLCDRLLGTFKRDRRR